MSFYLVSVPSRGTTPWLIWEDVNNIRIYAYLPNLGALVRHDALYQDFYRDMRLTYRPVSPAQAAQIVAEGQIGRLDARTHQKAILDELSCVTDRKAPADILDTGQTVKVSARQAALARAARVAEAKPGEWVTWRSYPPQRRQSAYVAAHDLRSGKVRALAGIPVTTQIVEDSDGQHLVQVTRTAARSQRAG